MEDLLAGRPLVWAVLAFWAIGLARGTATFALGRGASAGADRTRLSRWTQGPTSERARAFVDRFGPLAVALCYLTVGLQTAVLVTAGAGRMRWSRFLPAAALGALAWGAVYATVGFTVLWGVAASLAGRPWAAPVALAAVGVVLVVTVWHRRQTAVPACDDGQRPDGVPPAS